MNKILYSILLCSALSAPVCGQKSYVSQVWVADNGDGTYKNPVINAGQGQFYVVWANEEGTRNRAGISTFLIPEKTGGLGFGTYHDKPGFRPAPTATVHLKDVRIPEGNMIGPAGSGYLLLM